MKNFFVILFSLVILIGIFFIGYALITPISPRETKTQEEVQAETSIPKQTMETKNQTEELMKAEFPMEAPEEANALIRTNLGDIAIKLYDDKTPITVKNFRTLALSGFYDKTKFHRVIPRFMIQGGDPTSREDNTSLYGRGGPDYTIADEFVEGLSNVRGTIAMANTGQPNSGGSQFFINVIDNIGLDYDKPPLSSSHTVFGEVVKGIEIADAISKVKTGTNDIPLAPVIVERIFVR